jgi:hypothetical protein
MTVALAIEIKTPMPSGMPWLICLVIKTITLRPSGGGVLNAFDVVNKLYGIRLAASVPSVVEIEASGCGSNYDGRMAPYMPGYLI